MPSKNKREYPTEITNAQLKYLITAFENNMAEFYPVGREAQIARELLSLREQLAKQREPVVPPTIKISEVVAAVSPEQNRKWNGRVGYMAGWNACRDAILFTAAIFSQCW